MSAHGPRNLPVRLHFVPPDFRDKNSREPLRVDVSSISKRGTQDLQMKTSSQTAGQGSIELGLSSYGELKTGEAVELQSPQRDEYFWTERVTQHSKCGQGRQALSIYEGLLKGGFRPSSYMFVAVLKACSTLKDLEGAKRIHAEVVKLGLEGDVYVGTMLVNVYAKCGSLVEARRVFEKMPHRNVVSWTAMILGHVQLDEFEVALQLYTRMQREGALPNARTFVCVLKACSRLASKEGKVGGWDVPRSLEQVRAIHSDVVKGGFEVDTFVGNMLVDVYVKCGSLKDASLVFEQMTHHDVVSCTAMMLGYVQMQEPEEALQLYERMQQEGVVPDKRAFLGALKAFSRLADSEEGTKREGECVRQWCLKKVRAIHTNILERKLELDIYLGTMLVDVYAKCGSLVHARCVFEQLPRRDVVCWTAMILGYAQMGEGEEALMFYGRMQHEPVIPDERAFVAALMACGSVAALDKGKEIHARIIETGLEDTGLFVANCLIDMYGKCGSMVDAQQVFDTLPTKDVVTWSALIAGYARQGEGEIVFALFQNMTRCGLQPNGITFVSILTVCSHLGLTDKGQKYFYVMNEEFGISPGLEHYTCMVDLLGRAGQVHDAMTIATTMPFEPDAVVWESVLAACQKWGNVDLGREAFQFAMRVDRNNPAAYVLMSNIYAAAHMWEEVKNIQAIRSKAGGRKQLGRTLWTDIGGTVHAFVAVDREHPGGPDIYDMLPELHLHVGDYEPRAPP